MLTVSDAIATRRSVRGFLDQPVDPALLTEILTKAARAASGGNLQPWYVDLVTGDAIARLKAIMREKTADPAAAEQPEYDIYPRVLDQRYADRRFAVGEAMYAHIGIPRSDKAARRLWFARNFQFFNAPTALFICVERTMGPPQWSDLGMYLAHVMLLCSEAGLATCAQECWAVYPATIGRFLSLPDNRMLFCGMAIGYENTEEPANQLRTDRAPTNEWLRVIT